MLLFVDGYGNVFNIWFHAVYTPTRCWKDRHTNRAIRTICVATCWRYVLVRRPTLSTATRCSTCAIAVAVSHSKITLLYFSTMDLVLHDNYCSCLTVTYPSCISVSCHCCRQANGHVPVEFHAAAVDQRLIQQRSVKSAFLIHLPVIEIHFYHSVCHSLIHMHAATHIKSLLRPGIAHCPSQAAWPGPFALGNLQAWPALDPP